MSRFIALIQFLFALAGCSLGAATYSNRISDDGHDRLYSKARVQEGVARFSCEASDSGWCHYTLFPEHCASPGCGDQPLQRFTVARGQSRQIAGLAGFRVCVETAAVAIDRDCRPAPMAVAR